MSFCSSCGKEITGNTAFCPYCGQMNGLCELKGSALPSSSELRSCARKQLKGVWGQMALAGIIYMLIITVPAMIFSDYSASGFASPLYNPTLDTIFNLATYVVLGPMVLGLCGYFLKRVRGERIKIENLFDGFKLFLPSLLLAFFMYLFIFLWTLLLIIPGIIKALGYSMAFYIMYDNPAIGSLEALKESQIMMKGYKTELFFLSLSFIGWGILCILTLGIGFIWLFPYMNLSYANFYECLKKRQENSLAEPVIPVV